MSRSENSIKDVSAQKSVTQVARDVWANFIFQESHGDYRKTNINYVCRNGYQQRERESARLEYQLGFAFDVSSLFLHLSLSLWLRQGVRACVWNCMNDGDLKNVVSDATMPSWPFKFAERLFQMHIHTRIHARILTHAWRILSAECETDERIAILRAGQCTPSTVHARFPPEPIVVAPCHLQDGRLCAGRGCVLCASICRVRLGECLLNIISPQ